MSLHRDLSHHLDDDELSALGLAAYGDDLQIDRSVRFFNPQRISIGSHVRIDPFSVLSASQAGITIGSFVHLSVGVCLLGGASIVIEDFCGLSARVAIFSSNDDYSGGWLTNPTVPVEYRNITSGPVVLRRHAIVGAGSVILPGVTIGLGASVGALSLVNKSVPNFMVVAGNPIQRVGSRDQAILDREAQFLVTEKKSGLANENS